MAAKPIVNASRSGIVRACSKAEISKFTAQITQKLTGLGDRIERIERVFQTACSCSGRHELSYALSAFPADRVRLEATFLPDQTSEEADRQFIGRRRRAKRIAKAWRFQRSGRLLGLFRVRTFLFLV